MKKRIILACAIGISVIFMASGQLYVKADAVKPVQSNGNVIAENFGTGVIALYSSDIHYLQSELERLSGELHDNYAGENNNMGAEEE